MPQHPTTSTRPRADGSFDIRIDDLDVGDLDALPFGVIRLDREGKVLDYNTYEEQYARRSRDRVLGRHFFTEIAPCAQVHAFQGRFLEGVVERRLDVTFGFVFPFPHGDRQVFVTLYYQATSDAVWIIVRDADRSTR